MSDFSTIVTYVAPYIVEEVGGAGVNNFATSQATSFVAFAFQPPVEAADSDAMVVVDA